MFTGKSSDLCKGSKGRVGGWRRKATPDLYRKFFGLMKIF